MLSLISLSVATSVTATAITICSSNDREPHRRRRNESIRSRRSSKSRKSAKKGASKSSKSLKGKSSKSLKRKSSKSRRRRDKSNKSARRGSSTNSQKSARRSSATDSKKSSKNVTNNSKKSSKSLKNSKKQSSSTKTAKSSKTIEKKKLKKNNNDNSSSKSREEVLKKVPNDSHYSFPTSNQVVRSSTMLPIPNKLPFDPHGEVKNVSFSNTSKNRVAFKIKTSDKMLYRVNPVFGFVEAGSQAKVQVLRLNGEKKTDNLVVLTSEASKEDKDAKRIFENDQNREMVVVPLLAY